MSARKRHYSDDAQTELPPFTEAPLSPVSLARPLTVREITAARRCVAAHSHDAADCRELLAMLDLLPDGAA